METKKPMTKERLKQYKAMQTEMYELRYKLQHIEEDNRMVGNDVIMNYTKGYPVPQAVVGVDWKKFDKTIEKYEKCLEKLEKECKEIEVFIEEIEDSRTRCIFRLIFIDGKKQADVGKEIHLERSRISKEIDKYLKVAHKAQKAHV